MTCSLETLRRDLIEADYFPQLAFDVVEAVLAGQEPVACLVVPESALGHGTIGWHLTVLVLTHNRLVVVHVDDSQDEAGVARAVATTSSVALRQIKQVRMAQMVEDPAGYSADSGERALVVAIDWGTQRSLDLEAAECADPDCPADHGFQGSQICEDVAFNVSREINGQAKVDQTMAFLRQLWAAQSNAPQ